MDPTVHQRHFSRVTINGSGCWLWPGAVTKSDRPGGGGYAIARVDGKTRLLHRAMYEHHVGPIPDGATLDHLCRVRHCVNPAHLEPVTSQTNTLRGVGPTARNAVKTACTQGHPYDGDNLYVDKSGRRHCRTCRRERTQRWYSERGGREWHQARLRAQKEVKQ